MRFNIIGKITEGKRDSAYKLYDYQTKRSKVYLRKEIKSILNNQYKIEGFDLALGNAGEYILKRKNTQLWKSLLQLDGKGMPENKADKDKVTLIGVNGFKQFKTYIGVDQIDNLYLYTIKEAAEAVKKGELLRGIVCKDNRFIPYCTIQLTDTWMEEAGFEKDISQEEKIWVKKGNKKPEEKPVLQETKIICF